MEQYFTEAGDPEILRRFARDTLYFRRSIRDLAEFYGCGRTVEAVLDARQSWDYGELCRRMFAEANISHWQIDDGIWSGKLWSIEECGQRLPVITRRILRLENELAGMIEHYDSAHGLLSAFEAHVRRLAPTVAAFKSIIAYRTGLEITCPEAQAVERDFTEVRRGLSSGIPPRLAHKHLLDAMLWSVLRVAVDTGRPVQFHTGYGDPDLDLRLANPLHLRAVLEAPEFDGLNVVLLHCYPFVREAGYLASVYRGAYLDIGLTIPYTSIGAMRTAVLEALHLSPLTKVLYSSDAQRTPEMFWIAARWGRRVIGQAIDQTVHDGDLTADEGAWAASRMLHDNAAELYT